MNISFETKAGIVLLPATAAVPVESDKARQALAKDRNIRRSHLFPLIDAVAHFACSLAMVPQGCTGFDLPRSPWILAIGDDMHFAWGPDAFDTSSLDAAIIAADNCVLISSGPDPFPYRVARTLAVRDRRNVLLIETLPHQQEAWRARIDGVRDGKELPIFLSIPTPEAAE